MVLQVGADLRPAAVVGAQQVSNTLCLCASYFIRGLCPPAAHLQPRPGAVGRGAGGPRVPARGAARRSTRRRSMRAGSPRRARSRTRCSSASPTPRAAASSRPPTTTSSSSRAARTSRTPDPGRQSAATLGLLRLAALTGEHRYEAAAVGRSGCCTRSRRSTPRVRPPAAGARLPPLPRARGRARRAPTAARSRRVVRSPSGPTSCSPAAGGGVPLIEGREPVEGRPPPTCASASRADGR